jgi:hypothetical protein
LSDDLYAVPAGGDEVGGLDAFVDEGHFCSGAAVAD